MLAKRIIPCLDVKDGRVVKGIKFRNLRDAGDPVEQAAIYEEQGADELVFLDISASIDKRRTVVELVRRVAEVLFIPFTVGGGIRTVEDIYSVLRAGADKVSINTAAVQSPKLVEEASAEFGSQCIVVAIDAARLEAESWEVYIYSGTRPTGLNAVEWARKVEELGAGEILLTSIDADGTQRGYDVELTRRVSESVSIPVIASGGAGTPFHVYQVLTEGRADAALMASVLHYGMFTVRGLKKYLRERGVPVRTA